MAKEKGQGRSHLPDRKNAPKKTGSKRGVGGVAPLDPAKDDGPVKKDPEQPELLETPKPPPAPTVVKGRFAASILAPIYSSAPKTGDKLISIRLSLALTKDHEGIFPKIVEDAMNWVNKPNRPKASITVPAQTARFYLAHDVKEEEMGLPIAKVTNATIAVIQKKGEGRALKVTRFSFRLQVPWSREVSKFADANYDTTLWLEMKTTQEKLFDEDEEE